MQKEIRIPEIAENVSEGTITGILVRKGETIKADQDVVEVETDKAAVEVPSPFGGTVEEILVSEGDEVSVGQAIMKVETDEEADEEADEDADGDREAESRKESREEPAERDETAAPSEQKAPAAPSTPSAPDVPASPATRRLARELGVDITEVEGSGDGGRIYAEDVKGHVRDVQSRGGRAAGGEAARRPGGGGERREEMTRVRALTAERTTTSWQTIPHVTQHEEAELTAMEEFIERTAPRVEKSGGKLTLTAVLTKLAATALRVYPRFNASLDEEAAAIIYHSRVAIGIAADTDRGLLVPVIRDPDQKSVTSIALELGELARAAREGDLGPDQMQGATFTISNLGGIGGTSFTPIILPPQVGILGVARAATRPVHTRRGFEPREVLPLSLSYDHRVIDGADGARFTGWLKTAIEDPFTAMMQGGR